jgi:hypothetical protein
MGIGARCPKTGQLVQKFRDRREILRNLAKKQVFRGRAQHWNEAIGLDHGHVSRDIVYWNRTREAGAAHWKTRLQVYGLH